MALYVGSKKATVYRGNYKPVNWYHGNNKIAGYKEITQSGKTLSFNGTYKDKANLTFYGDSSQITTVQGKNLFDKNNPNNLMGYEWVGDKQTVSASWFISHYIPVLPSQHYYKTGCGSTNVYYDANKVEVSYQASNPCEVPANAYYVRFNAQSANINTSR